MADRIVENADQIVVLLPACAEDAGAGGQTGGQGGDDGVAHGAVSITRYAARVSTSDDLETGPAAHAVAYLGLGANLGDRMANLSAAKQFRFMKGLPFFPADSPPPCRTAPWLAQSGRCCSQRR